jgi:NAD(P)-dependent dehydrogenase (short-subunit alcohol dehydrogenase family)
MESLSQKEKASLYAPAIRMLCVEKRHSFVRCCMNSTVASFLGSSESVADLENLLFDYSDNNRKGILLVVEKPDIEEQYDELLKSFAEYKMRVGHPPAFVVMQNCALYSCSDSVDRLDESIKACLKSITDKFPATVCKTRSSLTKGRIAGKIIVVTGSAQGFGKGIAEALAGEGAVLVIADINNDASRRVAADICNRHGKGTAIAIRTDVTSEESIRELLAETVVTFGGIDVFISNAGILKAGSLEEMDLRSFDLVTKINYRAYFLCTKYASRYMKIQQRFKPDYYSDIIQINSKSGLEGSNRNFAYAGGKFGGIGLTQSFALELSEHNIKVNSVCPGNFFEGPLWSDPHTGLFAQYLRTGKVPGAKNIEDVKRFYEGKVPMKRGCSVRDVVTAVLYIIDQCYETGQAIPVTGGQIMMH